MIPPLVAHLWQSTLFAGAVWLEALRARPGLSWIRPVYIALLVLAGIVLAPDVMPILPPASYSSISFCRGKVRRLFKTWPCVIRSAQMSS